MGADWQRFELFQTHLVYEVHVQIVEMMSGVCLERASYRIRLLIPSRLNVLFLELDSVRLKRIVTVNIKTEPAMNNGFDGWKGSSRCIAHLFFHSNGFSRCDLRQSEFILRISGRPVMPLPGGNPSMYIDATMQPMDRGSQECRACVCCEQFVLRRLRPSRQ